MNRNEIGKNVAGLLYIIPSGAYSNEEIVTLLKNHPEVKFVSLVGIDLRGNDTDEKIPIGAFLEDMGQFLSGGVQTDGSSVVLPGIATLNNGKVDLIADISVNWFIDYNYEHVDAATGLPVGTLRIPSFLMHNGQRVDSRSILQNSVKHFNSEVRELLAQNPETASELGINPDDLSEIVVTAATELEFWVKTPEEQAETEELSISQVLQEQYWKRTKSNVRTSLEKSLLLLEKYGLKPEMGHKEVGGVKARVSGEGRLDRIMEQLEIDWKFSAALQAADNELLARILIKEVFRLNGLEVTFMAKPMEGVAGSGEHTHINAVAKLKSGKRVNLFAPGNIKKDYLSRIGWGAIMGLLKNYEVVNPFITSANDAFNRLKPGFEAPICIVASLGSDLETPSRNRTVLAGLIRDMDNPLSIRFEIRSPNPHTNTYLAVAAINQAMLDGIKYAVKSGKTPGELEKNFCKKMGEKDEYLEQFREYRSEEDVFEHYSDKERNKMFGVPPATVWENLVNLTDHTGKAKVLASGGVFESNILESYKRATTVQWALELSERLLSENAELVRKSIKLHGDGNFEDFDEELWGRINSVRKYLMKDSIKEKSLFTKIREAIDKHEYHKVSDMQLEMSEKVSELKKLYNVYKRNLIDYRQ
ncbi:MAG: glutamine synthetase [Ruminiclostridium sp.]|nr:glutamine synthetase [Ruminiclostridium sp.]